jgi:hypothetical protein
VAIGAAAMIERRRIRGDRPEAAPRRWRLVARACRLRARRASQQRSEEAAIGRARLWRGEIRRAISTGWEGRRCRSKIKSGWIRYRKRRTSNLDVLEVLVAAGGGGDRPCARVSW